MSHHFHFIEVKWFAQRNRASKMTELKLHVSLSDVSQLVGQRPGTVKLRGYSKRGKKLFLSSKSIHFNGEVMYKQVYIRYIQHRQKVNGGASRRDWKKRVLSSICCCLARNEAKGVFCVPGKIIHMSGVPGVLGS